MQSCFKQFSAKHRIIFPQAAKIAGAYPGGGGPQVCDIEQVNMWLFL